MHRSGTSAVAGVCQRLGVALGERLLRAGPEENPKGFWEHSDLLEVNERVLQVLGSSWDDVRSFNPEWAQAPGLVPLQDRIREILERDFSAVPLWGIKEPRLCRLLPFYLPVLDSLVQATFLHVLRPPWEVAQSLQHRNGFLPERSLLLWMRYVLEAEFSTRGRRRSFVAFPRLLADWKSVIRKVGRDLELAWPETPDEAQAAVDKFLESGLRHHRSEERERHVPSELESMAGALYEALAGHERLAKGVLEARLDEARQALEGAEAFFRGAVTDYVRSIRELGETVTRHEQRLWALDGQIQELQGRLARREKQIAEIYASTSWQVTAPLRWIRQTVKR